MIGKHLGVLLLALVPSLALAQPPSRGEPRVVQLEETIIHGRPQRPNAFYVLNRAPLGYRVEDLRDHFTAAIVQSVTRSPF